MNQRVSQKPSVVLNKGLITEAGELTFPEGASVDELNFSLERDGSRKRRLGLSYEGDYELFGTVGAASSVHVWENAGAVAGLNIVVTQLGNTLHFFQESETALSSTKYTGTIDLSSFSRPSGFGSSTVPIQTTVLEGKLYVASSEVNTFVITFDDTLETFTGEEIEFKVRDFEFQGDISEYYEPSANLVSVTDERKYDTANAGWTGTNGEAALTTYTTSETAYPPLSLPWYSGKDASGNFSVAEYNKVFAGTSLIANGNKIVDLYEKDRGVLGVETETTRFKTVAAFAGRVFFAGMSNKNSNKVFFSQVLFQGADVGDCHQVNDPTSEDLSDLLDTDGGVIVIPEAYNIQKLHVLDQYIMVFAENGVWSINGVDGVFRATGYAVRKVTEVGIQNAAAFVSAEGRPYWWSSVGIHTLQGDELQGIREQNLTLTTIQTFWADIGANSRTEAKGAYDEFNKRVVWFYPGASGNLTGVLTLDEPLGAFYPWSIAESGVPPQVLAPFFSEGNLTDGQTFDVVDSNGNQVVDSSGNNVTVTRETRVYDTSQIKLLVRDPSGQATFAEFSDTTFKDWGVSSYQSYMVAPYDFAGDLARRKRIYFVHVVCKVTEEGFSLSEDGSYEYIRPSSCLVTPYWDFSVGGSARPQQGYRIKEIPVVEDTTLTPDYTVTTSRLRLRGRGRSVRLRFESEEGKDLHLLGFDTAMGSNPR